MQKHLGGAYTLVIGELSGLPSLGPVDASIVLIGNPFVQEYSPSFRLNIFTIHKTQAGKYRANPSVEGQGGEMSWADGVSCWFIHRL